MNNIALKDLLYKIADDQLIIGHRNSEWTGIGPILEEDIAFSSMAQDKIGHSYAFFNVLHELGESDPDTTAFLRNAEQFHNCQFVELPIGEYDFSLVRHFLFDHSEMIRFEMLTNSSFEPISLIARKLKGEVKYHIMHANVWIKKLGTATNESIERLQKSLDEAIPFALGIFEESKYEEELANEKIFPGEIALKERWIEQISDVLKQTELQLPDLSLTEARTGGRYGRHTEYLQPLLDEMSEVIKSDPTAEW
ncbi:1,2-phenylacetyl-CoA epoxidase subunit PaaC [Fulvivirgaceae bacterium BMA10]|uniref:1,2-phenylacetyl-CoA epoxidase subunit PaaC n=1 Tax=Splendidivirga corallicola TaxID=3051826 RepID=A0ABT8KK85_9BACT|nr:1,2-phenylacetyl-CoA epoxidase subunit PaaC [Fulvivirgaceae bacterium BMA10]